MTFDEVQKLRELCLQNAEDLVKSARALTGKDVAHVQYHLAALALEEIGKSSLLEMQFFANQRIGDDDLEAGALESHVKKLFWAFWGPSFGQQRITKQQIEQMQGLATTVHLTRLETLYIALSDKAHPKKKLSEKEVDNIMGMAEALVSLEKTKSPLDPNDPSIDKIEIEWFLRTSNDPLKRKAIFSGTSMDKLVEFGNARDWIHWLKTEADKEDDSIRKILEDELSRQKPEGKDARKPKYKIKVKIISESHSLRNKHLEEWNKLTPFIQLHSDDKRTLHCEFLIQKSTPLQALYWLGWGMARSFVVALSIATRGFFWWNIPKDIDKYYEDAVDLERNMGLTMGPSKKLAVNWQEARLVLTKNDLGNASMMMYFLARIRGTALQKPLDDYCLGLAFTAKNDVHLRFEPNAFDAFYSAFKAAFLATGDWDGKSDFKEAVKRQFGDLLDDLSSLMECVDIGEELQSSPTHQPKKEITLTEVFAIKLYFDVYIFKHARKQVEVWDKQKKKPLMPKNQKASQQGEALEKTKK
ncbi:MAG TPA: AbiV family abortive infection protein [Patescibacteria group bacterium]|nr:AbiV family abortive infection protein [Patescibacteria group bacterium]